MNANCDDSLRKELAIVQIEIQQLGDKQKKLMKDMKDESKKTIKDVNKITITSNGESKHQIISHQLDKSPRRNAILNQSKPLRIDMNRKLPQSTLAVRTISGHTKLLVPVSAAVATAKKQSQPKQILVVPTPGGGARLATSAPGSILRPQRQRSRIVREEKPTHFINLSDYHQQRQQQLKEQYLRLKREEEIVPESKRKEDFLAALGLVTKQTLREIQNKKCERKRRTTANPQFSNAAIEAKRITAMEVAAKKARRREMMLSIAEKEIRESKRNSSRSKPIMNECYEKNRTHIPGTSRKPMLSFSYSRRNLKPVKVCPKCYVCNELCDPDLDAIMYCNEDRCTFHATCVATVDDINRTNSVNCPICDKKTYERSWDDEDEEEEEEEEEEEDEDDDDDDDEFCKRRLSEDDEPCKVNQEDEENRKNSISAISRESAKVKSGENGSILSENKINSNTLISKREKKEALLARKNELSKLYLEEKNKFAEFSSTFKNLQEEKARLLNEQKLVLESIEKIGNLVKLVHNDGKVVENESLENDTKKSKPKDAEKERVQASKDSEHSNYPNEIEIRDGDQSKARATKESTSKESVIEEWVGEDVFISERWPNNLANEDKCDDFEDETSAAVASIQDQMDVDL